MSQDLTIIEHTLHAIWRRGHKSCSG